MAREIDVRTLRTTEECEEAAGLQRAIWGFAEVEMIPPRFFLVAREVGGQTLGAFDGGRMIGFLLAVPALKQGQMFLHSHMLGVLEPYRDRGVGRLLKLQQREDALARGIGLVEWTFDPLQVKNAYFNIERLGAIVSRYVLNQYGTTSSPLHGGLPTDRCVAEWWLAGERVGALLAGRRPPCPPVRARIEIPAIDAIRREDPKRLREVQKSVSDQFLAHFANGLAVVGFERCGQAGTYLLGAWESR